ncbi:MAG: hypothetical protein KJO07_08340 [Deltaproteobacteria bacterium]|nr:hypothetical protein [Deltaproteobacteria bacterium]
MAQLVALVVFAGLTFGSVEANAAPDKADCQLYEIKATKDPKGGVDPALKPLAKKLSKPPFDSWKSFKLLARHKKTVERMKALELKLKPGGKLTLLYRDLISAPGKKPRLRLSLTLDSKSGKRVADLTIKLDSGDYNLIGGGTLPGGAAYILATTCKVK